MLNSWILSHKSWIYVYPVFVCLEMSLFHFPFERIFWRIKNSRLIGFFFFFFQCCLLKMLFHCLLAFNVSDEKTTNPFTLFPPVQNLTLFPLLSFLRFFSLPLTLSILLYWALVWFPSCFFGVHWASCNWGITLYKKDLYLILENFYPSFFKYFFHPSFLFFGHSSCTYN